MQRDTYVDTLRYASKDAGMFAKLWFPQIRNWFSAF